MQSWNFSTVYPHFTNCIPGHTPVSATHPQLVLPLEDAYNCQCDITSCLSTVAASKAHINMK